MGMMDYVKKCFQNYANFSGRARRSEYWYFCLFNYLVSFGIGLVFGFLSPLVAYCLSTLYSLAVFIPGLATWIPNLFYGR